MTWGRRAKPSCMLILCLVAFLVLAWCAAGMGASQVFASSDTTPPAVPSLVSPADGTLTDDTTPSFDWSDVSDPSGVTYRIQISKNANFITTERDESWLGSSDYTEPWGLGDGSYYWRVKAVDGASNESSWSDVWSLTIDNSSPPQPNLMSPFDWAATNDTTLTLDWSDVSDTSGVSYSLEIDDDSYFSSPVLLTKQGLASSDYTLSAGEALAEGTYYWRVKAIDGAGNDSGWSYSWRFTVDTSAPAAPNLTSPFDGTATNNAYPYFDWSDVSDPSGVSYSLEIANDSSFTSVVLSKQGLNNSDYGLGVGEALADSTYYWRVKAVDGAGNESAWSSEWSFAVDVTKPSAPTLASPTDGTLTNNQRPTFDWTDVTDPSGVSYRIQIDNNSNFSSPERDESNIGNSTWTMDWHLGDNTYYWRVKAVDGAGNESDWTGAWSFVLDASNPSTPSMVSPSGNINDTTPTFDWSDVSDTSGVSYSLEIDDDSYFSSPVLLTKQGLASSDYTLSAGEALAEGTYYWRVKAIDGAGNDSGWSGYWSFTVDTTPPAPTTLSSPADGTFTNTKYPNLNWSYVYDPSGVSYKLQIDDSSDFSSPERDKSDISGTGYTVTTPLDEKTYYWRVKAVDGAGNESAWSSEWSFAVDVTKPSAPTLASPTDGTLTNNQRPAFDWTDVTDPSGVSYRIQIDNDSNFFSPERDQSGIGSSTWTMDWNLGDNTYYWRVKAVDGANNESDWSGAWSLIIDNSSPPQPNLMSPSDWMATNDTTPSFDWSDVSDSSGVSYSFEIDDDSYFSSPVLLTKQGLASSDYTLSASEALAEGSYYWRVKAIDGAGNDSGWSYSWTFTVDTSAPGVPNLTSPSDGTAKNSATPRFEWSDVSDPSGVSYNLEIANDSGFTSVVLSKQGLHNRDYSLSAGEALAEGTYYWRVKAIDNAGNSGNWSSIWTFTVDTTAPSVPSLASPADGALINNNSPSFDWADVSDPSGVSYRIQISRHANFGTMERDESWLGSSDYTDPWGLGDGTYYWRVRAVDGANNESSWSDAWSLTIDANSPPQPNLMTPHDWAATNNTTPGLDWSDVTDSSGVSYSVEIDDDSNFSSPVLLTKQGLATSDYTLSAAEALADGTYYWRVRAIDGAGNDSGWSGSWAFTVDTSAPAAPNLSSPSDGSMHNNSNLGFDWSDVGDPSGVTYKLEIASDSSFSSVVLSEQGFDHSDYGLGGWGVLADGTYYWRVKAIDDAGNSGNWSNSWMFIVDTSAPSVPNLISPSDGTSTNDPFALSFDWSDVSDPSGVSYNLQIAWDSNFFKMEHEEWWIGDSTYVMSRGLPDGTMYWRVQAVDGANNESGWSDSWSFTVETQGDSGQPPPDDGSASSPPVWGEPEEGPSGGPPLPIIGGGLLLVVGSALGYLMIRRRRRTAALRREFKSKLERWEAKGYDVSALKDKWFS